MYHFLFACPLNTLQRIIRSHFFQLSHSTFSSEIFRISNNSLFKMNELGTQLNEQNVQLSEIMEEELSEAMEKLNKKEEESSEFTNGICTPTEYLEMLDEFSTGMIEMYELPTITFDSEDELLSITEDEESSEVTKEELSQVKEEITEETKEKIYEENKEIDNEREKELSEKAEEELTDKTKNKIEEGNEELNREEKKESSETTENLLNETREELENIPKEYSKLESQVVSNSSTYN